MVLSWRQAGEFTLRAFLAGRLDLAQCEAVLGVIHADSETSLQTALQQLAGGLHLPVRQLRQHLIDLLADLEAGLDFVEEDIEFISQETICQRLQEAQAKIRVMLVQMENRLLQHARPSVALMGLPNAGKSSLFNALCGREAAIVADLAGTTRDFVRASLPPPPSRFGRHRRSRIDR